MSKNERVLLAGEIPLSRTTIAVSTTEPFPLLRVKDIITRPDGNQWLVEQIWPACGVGVLAAIPKIGKTWLALELAVAVASGTPFLGAFKVGAPGRVLMFAAEDQQADIRTRISNIARARQVKFEDLDLFLIDAVNMTLNKHAQFARLTETVRQSHAVLLILDPLVRLFRGSENDAGAVSKVLGWLRSLQRECDVSIMLVHHTRKQSAGAEVGGQSIRGSGDFHAWGDVNIFLRKRAARVEMAVEHRTAASPDPFGLRLSSGVDDVHFDLLSSDDDVEGHDSEVPENREASLRTKALEFMTKHPAEINRDALRKFLSVRNERVGELLDAFEVDGTIVRDGRSWRVIPGSVPAAGLGHGGDGNDAEDGDSEDNDQED